MAAAGPDNSLTQSCPGSSSSPDGCLIRMCRENRPRNTRGSVPMCVCVHILSIPCCSLCFTQGMCYSSCSAFQRVRGKSQPLFNPPSQLWTSFEVFFFFFLSLPNTYTNLNTPHSSFPHMDFCLLPGSQLPQYVSKRGCIVEIDQLSDLIFRWCVFPIAIKINKFKNNFITVVISNSFYVLY